MKKSAVEASDIGYGALGALGADTAVSSVGLYRDAGKMRRLHEQALDDYLSSMVKGKGKLGPTMPAENAGKWLDAYSDLAGKGLNRRLFGVRTSEILRGVAPALDSGPGTVLGHALHKLNLGGSFSDTVDHADKHYTMFRKNPRLAMFRELVGDDPTQSGLFDDLKFDKDAWKKGKRYGALREMNQLMSGETPVSIQDFAKRHGKAKGIGTVLDHAFKGFFTNYQSGNKLSRPVAFQRGMAAYAKPAKPVAIIAGLLGALGAGTAAHKLTEKRAALGFRGIRSIIDNLRRATGRLDDVAEPLFGKQVADRARRHGTATSTWADDSEQYGALRKAQRAVRDELNNQGWGGLAMFNRNNKYSHVVHNLRNFKGVMGDAVGAGPTHTPGLMKKIKQRGGRVIGEDLSPDAAALFKSKLGESKLLESAGGARSSDLAAAMAAAGYKGGRVTPRQAAAMLEHLKGQIGPQFIVKPQVSNASAPSTLLHAGSTPRRAANAFNNGIVNILGERLGKGGPAKWMAQEKLDIAKMPWMDRVFTGIEDRGGKGAKSWKELLNPSAVPKKSSMLQEVRVHAMGGKAIPYASHWRGASSTPFSDKFRNRHLRAAERETQRFLDNLPPEYRKGTYGFDMVRTRDGRWVPLEMNPATDGASGFMTHGSANDEAVRAALAGKIPESEIARRQKMMKDVVYPGAATVGATGLAGGAALAMNRDAVQPAWASQTQRISDMLGRFDWRLNKSAADDNYATAGAIAAGSLPAASLAQYYAKDLPALLRRADEISKLKPLKPGKLLAGSATGDIGIQMSPPGRLRDAIRAGLTSKGGERIENFIDKLQLGYGPSATSGSPARHAFMTVGGRVFETGSGYGHSAEDIKKQLKGKKLSELLWRGGDYSDVFNSKIRSGVPQVTALMTPNNPLGAGAADIAGKRMVANTMAPYPGAKAFLAGLTRVLTPRLPGEGRLSSRGISCVGGHCAQAPATALAEAGRKAPAGLRSIMPVDYLTDPSMKVRGIATRGLEGSDAIRKFLRSEIKMRGGHRTAIGLGATALTAGIGALLGRGIKKEE